METLVEVVKEVLAEKLNAKRIRDVGEEYEDCRLLAVEYGDDVFLIGLWSGSRAFYAKLVAASMIRGDWRCSTLEYTPVGFYAFSDTPRHLAEKIVEKIHLLENIKSRLKTVLV